MTLRVYWASCGWRCGNAGDEFTRDVVGHLSGRPVLQQDEAPGADMVASGSIAQNLTGDFSGTIWGTGLMFEHMRIATPLARVCALRGKLTARRWEGVGEVPLGDPGLLAAEVYGLACAATPRYQVGFVPHYADGQNEELRIWARAFRDQVTVIDICGPPREVLTQMSNCQFILSSSLHGLVFADSLGVPNEWVSLGDNLAGGSFKFRDYYSVFGITDPLSGCWHRNAHPEDILARVERYERPGLDKIKSDLVGAFPFRGPA